MDKINQNKINKLHPKVREDITSVISDIEEALTGRAKVRIVQGFRSFAEQDALYAQGRTKSGKIVTNAKGGSSYHNYGLAVDFALLIDNKEISWDMEKDWDGDKITDWMEVVYIFKKYGWEWGGTWKSLKDYPHFQKTFNYTVKDLKAKWDKNETFLDNEEKYIIIN